MDPNRDPFPIPDLAEFQNPSSSDVTVPLIMLSVQKEAEARGLTLKDYLQSELELANECPYPTEFCLSVEELEQFGLRRGKLADERLDHLAECRYCSGAAAALADFDPENVEDIWNSLSDLLAQSNRRKADTSEAELVKRNVSGQHPIFDFESVQASEKPLPVPTFLKAEGLFSV